MLSSALPAPPAPLAQGRLERPKTGRSGSRGFSGRSRDSIKEVDVTQSSRTSSMADKGRVDLDRL
jgi:hypothetical protein